MTARLFRAGNHCTMPNALPAEARAPPQSLRVTDEPCDCGLRSASAVFTPATVG
jgi:hypothetical protein